MLLVLEFPRCQQSSCYDNFWWPEPVITWSLQSGPLQSGYPLFSPFWAFLLMLPEWVCLCWRASSQCWFIWQRLLSSSPGIQAAAAQLSNTFALVHCCFLSAASVCLPPSTKKGRWREGRSVLFNLCLISLPYGMCTPTLNSFFFLWSKILSDTYW